MSTELYDTEMTDKQEEVIEKTAKQIYYDGWYETNRERHLERLKEKIHCDVCDKYINRSSKSRHEKTKAHQRKLEDKK